ncbi:CKLF-like MARVEL transmembrane domain-containing protein 6 [Scyliorhinus canicula]|uniref:CKLF-like MARVEL transmembrane domain-containing protein 6 n=1 Tax=Scyliorhinus canicula TaxID=7830 RepID=UPI0018F3C26A|nr:CKLF-like MARVEL transmembrane domain-containing protein 6 [Scyliorhinus canicula]XP_038653819.1 CKLF-like MARVEL transmembrane domain-containing protein 6 [Scyliorhinus canicula]XP_038653820.1 CKLF-like MARVEL transmembrane domain-containing protein 6 [Scyliorhinus canicula]
MPHQQERGNGGMESEQEEVYRPTTEPLANQDSCCQLGYLKSLRGMLKVAQVILSFVAFILEEVVNSCMSCHALYFFEFVSCSAFLLTTFLLIILATCLQSKLDRINWRLVDFTYTAVISLFFLIASIIFATKNDGSGVEKTSVAFGFMATIAFVLDVLRHLWQEGPPWKEKKDKPAEPNKGTGNVKGETEPLNEPGNLPV